MANWYYRKITEGKIAISEVPPKWREQVKKKLEGTT